MSTPQTATAVAAHLAELSRQLDLMVRRLAEHDEAAVRARARYEVAFAREFLSRQGSVDARKQAARLACADEWLAAGIADQTVRAGREAIRALNTRIDVGRSHASAIKAEVALAGSGITP